MNVLKSILVCCGGFLSAFCTEQIEDKKRQEAEKIIDAGYYSYSSASNLREVVEASVSGEVDAIDQSNIAPSEEEFWCLPGCLLFNDLVGDPVVPDWCTAWGKVGPLSFDRERNLDGLPKWNSIIDFSYKNSDANSTPNACIRINTTLLGGELGVEVPEALFAGDEQLPDDAIVDALSGRSCRPGCSVSWKKYGHPGGLRDIEEQPRTQLPDWCEAIHDGCIDMRRIGSNEAVVGLAGKRTCEVESTTLAVCTTLRIE